MKNINITVLKKIFKRAAKTLFFATAIYLCVTHITVPSSELGKRIFSGVSSATILGLFAGLVFTYMRSPSRVFSVAIPSFLTALIINVIVSSFIDEAIAKPVEAIVFLIPILCFWFVYRCSNAGPVSSYEAATGTASSLTLAKNSPQKMTVSDKDRNTIAAHEAGHALVYAALGNLPENFHIKIKTKPDESNSMGYVSGMRIENCLNYKTESEWFMLVLLAGKRGEVNALDYESLGATGDMLEWLGLASQYLSNQYRGIYYPAPANDLEIASNKIEIKLLRDEQNLLLDDFFKINNNIHQKLTQVLLERGTITREESILYLEKVQFPDGFPLLPELAKPTQS